MLIEIYTSKTCAPCIELKRYLDRKGHDYTEIDAEDPRAEEVFKQAGGRVLPTTVVDGKYIVRGLNIANFNRVIERW